MLLSLLVYRFVTKKFFESYFSDRLTFSNIRSRTSHRIYRLALPLRAPEMLSSLTKSRSSIFNAHFALFGRRMTSHNSIGKYRHVIAWAGVIFGIYSRVVGIAVVKSHEAKPSAISPLYRKTSGIYPRISRLSVL